MGMKLTILGETHSGKTCYLLGMQRRMSSGIKEHSQLVEDVLHYNHDLYKFLCADKENVRQLYKQRYELKWLELHWKKCEQLLNVSSSLKKQSLNLPRAAKC